MEEQYQNCIGRRLEQRDVITERAVAEFQATLAPHLFQTGAAPLGIHWCLSPDMVAGNQLGGDGHPKLGQFLPDVGLPRRMWAGGAITFRGSFSVGDVVNKVSTIADQKFKEGKSGKLCFFTVTHQYTVDGNIIVDERQDIVYREAASSNTGSQAPALAKPQGTTWLVVPTSTLLFRYSAMAFNGHRIHYDESYARNTEHYGGLMVHGPLQATLMLNLAATVLGRAPKTFSYRGVAPLILGSSFIVDAETSDGSVQLQVIDASGTLTMTGEVQA